MYWSDNSTDANLNSEKLPIFDFYFNLKTDWLYDYRYRIKSYTGLRYRYYCIQVILFRRTYTISGEYNKQTICPIEAKFLASEENKKWRLKNNV